MNKAPSEARVAVIPILRDDGTVYFQYASKTFGERLCEWTLALLWVSAAAVTIAAFV
jgi:hypothetical protein